MIAKCVGEVKDKTFFIVTHVDIVEPYQKNKSINALKILLKANVQFAWTF